MQGPDTRVCALDFGASGGKVFTAVCRGETLELQEVLRFPNGPVLQNGRLHWDLAYLQQQAERGLAAAFEAVGALDGVSVDTWGFDFVRYNAAGRAESDPLCYRDAGHARGAEAVSRLLSASALYAETGLPPSRYTTLTQLCAGKRAERILWMPDALLCGLGGSPCAELTIASTSQLLNTRTGAWSAPALAAAGLRADTMPPLVRSGTITGELRPALQRGSRRTRVIASAGHDTAAAVAALPAEEDPFLYLVCGTWSLLGAATRERYTDRAALQGLMHNQTAADGGNRLQKGVTGLWLCQQLREAWRRGGGPCEYAEQERLAAAAAPLRSQIDPDLAQFTQPGDMQARILEFCTATGQQAPETPGAVLRCIYESLALKCRLGVRELEAVTGRRFQTLYTAGGGVHSALLMQLLADATGKIVLAGYADASALGNALVQLVALGALSDLRSARAAVRRQFPARRFTPREIAPWVRAEAAFLKSVDPAARRQ